MSSDIRAVPAPGDHGPSFFRELSSVLTGGSEEAFSTIANKNPKFPPLDVLPCANINAERYTVCEKPGKLACSSCRLVSYCSKECQKAHWATHKSDCKSRIISNDWKPGWVLEGREPRFMDDSSPSLAEKYADRPRDKPSLGSSLWGNVPAMDIVSLPNNEKDLKKNLSLAFAASGDIRNVITTVNALGPDYSGELNILLNDFDPHTVSRNITLLLILGTIPDEAIAADIALHFWYSVFIPAEYHLRILSVLMTLLKKGNPDGSVVAPLGPHSVLTCLVTPDVKRVLAENAGHEMSPDRAQVEYERVKRAPSRADFWDRMYMLMRPSHRRAFLEHHRFGIILPFGALNAHCNMANPSLFSNGAWLQTDYADPLESWDMDKVFSAGRAHGAQPEDVYGCLYFFLSDQLRAFVRNIRQLRISFRVFNFEACALAEAIAQGEFTEYGIPSTIRFDRIDVSNIMDPNYAGIQGVMNTWGPLLAKTDNAALTGYFMNWVVFADEGRVASARSPAFTAAFKLMKASNLFQLSEDPMLIMLQTMKGIDAFHDTSSAFSKYWKDHGGANAKLQLRSIHKIIPHRLKTAVDAKPDALPGFADNEEWYRYTRLNHWTWTERFVELSHSKE